MKIEDDPLITIARIRRRDALRGVEDALVELQVANRRLREAEAQYWGGVMNPGRGHVLDGMPGFTRIDGG